MSGARRPQPFATTKRCSRECASTLRRQGRRSSVTARRPPGSASTYGRRGRPRTRAKVTCRRTRPSGHGPKSSDQVPFSPAAKLPRPRDAAPRCSASAAECGRPAVERGTARHVIALGLLFLLDLGVRRAELAGIRVARLSTSAAASHRVRERPEEPRDPAARPHRPGARGLPARSSCRSLPGHPSPTTSFSTQRNARSGGRMLAAYPKRADEPTDDPPLVVPARVETAGLVGHGMTSRAQHAPARGTPSPPTCGASQTSARPQQAARPQRPLDARPRSTGTTTSGDLERAMDAFAQACVGSERAGRLSKRFNRPARHLKLG